MIEWEENIDFYYPAPLSRVQITRERSKNIPGYFFHDICTYLSPPGARHQKGHNFEQETG